MARSVFVDTSGWYALIDRRDAAHTRTAALVRRLITGGARLIRRSRITAKLVQSVKERGWSS